MARTRTLKQLSLTCNIRRNSRHKLIFILKPNVHQSTFIIIGIIFSFISLYISLQNVCKYNNWPVGLDA